MFTGMFISAVALTYATPMTNVGLIVTVTLLSLTNVTVGLNTLLFGWGAGGGGDGGGRVARAGQRREAVDAGDGRRRRSAVAGAQEAHGAT